jgi:LIVCS family branched-chain amino acid:cation transporter
VNSIITIAVPVLTIIYPVVMVLIVLSIFDKKIKYNWTYSGAVVGAFVVSSLEGLGLFGQMAGIKGLVGLGKVVSVLPLAQDGFGWIVPAIFGSILFTLISKYTKMGSVGENYRLLEERR